MGAASIRIADPTQKLEKIQIKLSKDWKVKNAKVDKNNTVTKDFLFGQLEDHSYEFSVQKE
jgi:hypothetical protein